MTGSYTELDSVLALVDLCARSGVEDLEIGFMGDEDGPTEDARWYAQAKFRGARVWADERHSPDEACDALARRILAGGRCTNCH